MQKREDKTVRGGAFYSVSEGAVNFIRTWVLPVKQIDFIDKERFDEIFDLAEEWELDMIGEEGFGKDDDPFAERNFQGMNFVSEITMQDREPDLDDLNRRLGLRRP